ncbi:LysR family transcriptional regulator [Conexibacter sp. CPCC 206217]|uniref:LysR family transcriptional regulator n=1 Tax=Conexibacter sp. CPCC 206217 TaxID=3064574 RepID=UPI0027219330|nr:LysR family transcriptional regulator [Conexibacter sp. CPCC 206217]MDO8209072.1 LysR family transcriptional regulator [Conexibacter sp. CPCC 206217]
MPSSRFAIRSNDLMELRHLTTFVAVAEEGSFTRAADRLHVVQSAVSAGVRTLERDLGAQLFDRSTAHVALTDAGRALLPEARRVLAAAAVARESVELVKGGLRGTIRLGTMQAQGMRAFSVPALLAAFRVHHPDVDVQAVHGGGSLAMADELRDGSLDLAFLSLPERRPAGLTLTLLGSEPMMLACPREHRLAGRAGITLSALAQESFAELPPGWGTRMASDRVFAAAGVRRTIAFEVNDTASLVDFVRHGLAIALLPPSMAAGTDLAFVPIRHHAPLFETFVAVPSDRRPSASTRALLQTLKTMTDQQARFAAAPNGDLSP